MIAGRYRLERQIGRGGSGTVHLALDEVLGRQVAIKRIGLIPGSDSAELERAERALRLTGFDSALAVRCLVTALSAGAGADSVALTALTGR